ncbi:hypothetical protein AB0O86_35305 [Streptomyces hirsutus]|uniref:hypothetical protein n=1 Tax=Streptomyces hirsutus TaxID=35620 RepID=UPI00343EC020
MTPEATADRCEACRPAQDHVQLGADLRGIRSHETVTAWSGLANTLVIVAETTAHLAVAAALTWWG